MKAGHLPPDGAPAAGAILPARPCAGSTPEPQDAGGEANQLRRCRPAASWQAV